MSSRGRGSDGQDDVDAAFAAIVADLERDGFGRGSDEETTLDLSQDLGRELGRDRDHGGDHGRQDTADPGRTTAEQNQPPEVWRGSEVEWDWAAASDNEHYVPPEPPPMPRLRAGTIAAIAMMLLGGLLLIVPQLIGIPARIGTPIALVCLATGIGLLVLRMRSGPPPDTGWDDGAQV